MAFRRRQTARRLKGSHRMHRTSIQKAILSPPTTCNRRAPRTPAHHGTKAMLIAIVMIRPTRISLPWMGLSTQQQGTGAALASTMYAPAARLAGTELGEVWRV